MRRSVLKSVDSSCLREQIRNENEAVTMLSRSLWAALADPFHQARLPPLNFSLQSAAVYLRGFAGLAHGGLQRGGCQTDMVASVAGEERGE